MDIRDSFFESRDSVLLQNGIEVLAPKDHTTSMNLPERSTTPKISYLLYRKNGDFNQLMVFVENHTVQFKIGYSVHDGKKSLYIHYFTNGIRGQNPYILPSGDAPYESTNHCLRG